MGDYLHARRTEEFEYHTNHDTESMNPLQIVKGFMSNNVPVEVECEGKEYTNMCIIGVDEQMGTVTLGPRMKTGPSIHVSIDHVFEYNKEKCARFYDFFLRMKKTYQEGVWYSSRRYDPVQVQFRPDMTVDISIYYCNMRAVWEKNTQTVVLSEIDSYIPNAERRPAVTPDTTSKDLGDNADTFRSVGDGQDWYTGSSQQEQTYRVPEGSAERMIPLDVQHALKLFGLDEKLFGQSDTTQQAKMLRKAYHALAQKYHPDTNTDPDATQKVQEVNLAKGVLKEYYTLV